MVGIGRLYSLEGGPGGEAVGERVGLPTEADQFYVGMGVELFDLFIPDASGSGATSSTPPVRGPWSLGPLPDDAANCCDAFRDAVGAGPVY